MYKGRFINAQQGMNLLLSFGHHTRFFYFAAYVLFHVSFTTTISTFALFFPPGDGYE